MRAAAWEGSVATHASVALLGGMAGVTGLVPIVISIVEA